MLKDCWTWAADAYASLAPELGSLKSMTQVPTAVKLTSPALIAQPVDATSRVISTWSPEVAVAFGEYEAPPTTAFVGALVVGVMTSTIDPGKTRATLSVNVPPAVTATAGDVGCGEAYGVVTVPPQVGSATTS